MRILITNDDGFGSEGLLVLSEALSRRHEICIFAPDRERSGVSHALTLGDANKVTRIRDGVYTCSGTPADCVLLATLGAIGFEPEAVVSGINRGANLGTDIVYSGTCAAAREAVIQGVPGIAVSCAGRAESFRYGAAASFVLENLEILAVAGSGVAFVNINAPSADDASKGAEWCSPCLRVYGNQLNVTSDERGFTLCSISSGGGGVSGEGLSDHGVVGAGKVSVSLILVHPQVPAAFLPGREFR